MLRRTHVIKSNAAAAVVKTANGKSCAMQQHKKIASTSTLSLGKNSSENSHDLSLPALVLVLVLLILYFTSFPCHSVVTIYAHLLVCLLYSFGFRRLCAAHNNFFSLFASGVYFACGLLRWRNLLDLFSSSASKHRLSLWYFHETKHH